MDLSPPSPLRCRMWRAQSISRRNWNVVVKFLDEICETQKFSSACTGCVELCFARTETDCCLFHISVAHRHSLWLQWHPVTLWRVAESPARSESLRPANSSKPFWTVMYGSRRWQVLCVPLGHRIICFTARLLSLVGLRTLCGQLLEGELHVWSPRCHEDEFSDGCANVWVIMAIQRNCCRELHHCQAYTWIDNRCRVFQPVKIQEVVREVCTVYHLETPARLPRVVRLLSYEPTCRFFFFAGNCSFQETFIIV